MQPLISSLDEANRTLIDNVHPEDWRNPTKSGVYDLIAIGGGTAGLVCAAGAAALGARVALIERHLLGGDCLNTGCVPSKALLRSARVIGEMRRAPRLGVRVGPVDPDFAAIMQRMRERRAAISPHDSAQRLSSLGVDVYFGDARFVGTDALVVDGQRLRFARAVIATGSHPTASPIPGLASVPFLTSETLFSLSRLPPRLAIVGGGPIGCEMAQAFARFGSAVTIVEQADHVLPREDPDAAALVEAALHRDGVTVATGVRLLDVSQTASGYRLGGQTSGGIRDVVVDDVLVAAGRSPNTTSLDLDAARVSCSKDGIVVDDRLRTSNRRIYAAGDVCSRFQFTHAAEAMARIVIQNALFFGRRRASALTMPWCTYTDPEVAHVGLYEAEARSTGRRVETITVRFDEVDRALIDEETEGFVRVHHDGGQLLGCTIVAPHAGEMIGEAVYAVAHGGTLTDLSSTIHPYPTLAEALRKTGDQFRRGSLTPGVRRWLERYFRWTRS